MTILKLYNSLTRKKEDFTPLRQDDVRLYACGPTVYNYAHIGNARMAVVFDQLVRVLRVLYPDKTVVYASNITDVDDKIMAAARETGEPIETITRKYERIYNEDMAALGVAVPDIQPRATEHIAEMIVQIEQLIANGHAYAAENHVLFDVPSFPEYGKLSGRSRDDQIAGARVEIAPYKKDAADFILWKPSTEVEVGWPSPWGRGRPGWHIECSAMSEAHLGVPFDIHGGGADLKFPHHENEIAQSCCSRNSTDLSDFAKFWIHNGFVTVEGEKMSKSLGNFTTVHDLLDKGVKGEVIRLALLSAQYRSPLDWSQSLLEQTESQLNTIYRTLHELKDVDVSNVQPVSEKVLLSLCNDLNTAGAISGLKSLERTAFADKSPQAKIELIAAGKLLGILQHDPEDWLGYAIEGDTQWIENLLLERTDAKKANDFKRADEIRNELAVAGITIEDTPQGPKWRKN